MVPNPTEPRVERRPRVSLPASDGALRPRRDSTAYELLRDRSAAYAAEHGHTPQVTVRTLGTQRDFGARQLFVTNLLAAAGIGVVEEGSPVAVIASSKAGYAAHAAEAVSALRGAGAERVLVAGRKRELPDDVTVDAAIHDGMDVVALLTDLLDRLGAPAEGAAR
jgi:methylmalonyl-CoA mutase